MTREELISELDNRIGFETDNETYAMSESEKEFYREIRKALEIVEEFEKAQIITGGRLNGRTYAYKCGLEEGKRKALEQQPNRGKDTDFVPVETEFLGKKGSGYFYKPQQIIVTGYITLEAFEHFGGKYKEKEGEKEND